MAGMNETSKQSSGADSTRTRRRRGLWITVSLLGITLVALLGALLWRGGASLGFLVAFVALLPLTLASALLQWWPMGREQREKSRRTWWRHGIIALGVSLGLCAAVTLVLGVAWSGSRVGNMLLVSGITLLPPAAMVGLLAAIGFRARDLSALLGTGERVEIAVKAHWTVFVLPLLVLSLAVVLALGPFGTPGLAFAAAIYLIGLPGAAGLALARFIHSAALLADRHLYLSYGVFRQNTASLHRDRIKAVGVKQNVWTRLLGLGKLSVVDDRGESIVVAGLKKPNRLARKFSA